MKIIIASKTKYTIDCFYDRQQRLWTCLWLDKEGNQVGAAQYAINRAEKDELIKLMRKSEPVDYQV